MYVCIDLGLMQKFMDFIWKESKGWQHIQKKEGWLNVKQHGQQQQWV